MTHPEARADRVLTLDIVKETLFAQFPEFDQPDTTIEFLGSGWDNDAYVMHTKSATTPARETQRSKPVEWVVRFPRRAEVVSRLQRELTWLPRIQAALDSADAVSRPRPPFHRIAVPSMERVGTPSKSFPYPFAAYRTVPGTPLTDERVQALSRQSQAEIARALGGFFRSLHSIPCGQAGPLNSTLNSTLPDDSPNFAYDAGSLGQWISHVDNIVDDVLANIPETTRARCARWLEQLASFSRHAGPAIETSARAMALLHNDLGFEHVLIAKTGNPTVTGIIDFGDLDVGDPAIDLAHAAVWLGAAGSSALLNAYQDRRDQSDRNLRCRVAAIAPLIAMDWINECLEEQSRPGAFHVAALASALETSAFLGLEPA